MAYSKEIKEKVIADLGQGKKAIQISEETGISIPTIQKWKKEAGLVQERKTIEVVPEETSVVEEKRIERNQQKEQIKDLIKKGFDLELLAFELDIPIEEIKRLNIELQKSQQTTEREKNARKKANSRTNQPYLRIKQMREKYKQLFFGNASEEKRELSQQQIELIDSVIGEIQETVNGMKETSGYEKRARAVTILSKIKQIKKYPFTIEQVEKLNSLLQNEELKRVALSYTDRIDFLLNSARGTIIGKFVEAIDVAQAQTEDLEELKALARKLTIEMEKENPVFVSTTKSKIYSKITKVQQQKAIERIKKDIPIRILGIVRDLANGTIDIQQAKIIMEEEAKKRVESGPKTNFSLTEEQEKREFMSRIQTEITERAEEYPIQNPEATILQIQELLNMDATFALRTVVVNLIARKDFETAKGLCNKFSGEAEPQTVKYLRNLRRKVINAEIGDLVLKVINMEGTEEEARAYYEIIEKGLKKTNTNLRTVSIGKTRDGLRTITLADIWEEQAIR